MSAALRYVDDPHLARALKLAEVTAARRAVPIGDPAFDHEDLFAEAYLAAVLAHRTWKAGRGQSRDTRTIAHTRWAMAEFLRRMDWLPRSVRKRVADGMHEGDERFQRPASIDLLLLADEEEVPRRHGLPSVSLDLDALLTRVDVARALTRLSPRHRRLLSLLFQGGLTYREAAAHFDVGETRICQMVGEAKVTLRTLLADPEGETRMSMTPAQQSGEGRATYENVFDYLKANCVVDEGRLEAALETGWAKRLLTEALLVSGAAYWAGDRIARRMGWQYRDGRG
jgi:RNA polymerase sigma factor (sigma-70 family)